MARNAHPEVTERRILEAARDLFVEKGYEKTTIQNIVDRLGNLSKGAIYHHFASKEAILDRLNGTDWNHSQGIRDQIMARTDLTGLERLRALFRLAVGDTEHSKLNQATMPMLNDPVCLASNMHFWAAELPDHWLPIIEQGVADGSIPTEYPREAAELIALLTNYWLLPMFYPASTSELRHRVRCFAIMLDAINVPVFDEELIEQTIDFYLSLNGSLN
ncbi:TetR/AcrR family transcriptional regulator [Bifidobacterium sp. UTBIF-78]|uniref:TetR/AcrR family transcriptional regulator n=1 Tax=Bifidobacterium sp. UTBIF-78 TaxID=1465263 RepID=UPI00112A5F1D|nr:TetR/AcrR family transcriptional regulator [Bifidobacterium sp. UTBIF-78]TPF92731.1 AcrR family transcriptional regulator [Bifidobacterium sp. UTBIF-78]